MVGHDGYYICDAKCDAIEVSEMSETDERLVAPSVVANHLGVSEGQLAQMRYLGTGPVFIKVGSRVRYRMSDVAGWLDDNTRTQTGVAS